LLAAMQTPELMARVLLGIARCDADSRANGKGIAGYCSLRCRLQS